MNAVRCVQAAALLAAWLGAVPAPAHGAASLRFFGHGFGDIDRVKIRIDPPDLVTPGPPADVGTTDFTLEFWMRAHAVDNLATPVNCGANEDWIFGNIVIDRDRYAQGRKFGLAIAGRKLVFGVTNDAQSARTICGTSIVLDGAWHHVAVERRRSDGRLWLFVDGALEAEADGPDGDVSYPDDGVPGDFCGGPCVNSDPFLVLGAEKHDAGTAYPSFSGWLDELRISTVLRYAAPFARPDGPFASDAATAALYHFDEGAGDTLHDVSGAPGGPSPGAVRFGGSPTGPQWSVDAFATVGVGDGPPAAAASLRAAPNPFHGRAVIVASWEMDEPLVLVDAAGREVATLAGAPRAGARVFEWDGRRGDGTEAPPGVYFARARTRSGTATLRLVRR